MKVDILCVGTPKVIGDSVGPLVGSMLLNNEFEHDVQIVGTLENPVIRHNFIERTKELRQDALLVVVDAIIGDTVGSVEVIEGPMSPGAAMSLGLPLMGDFSIKCCVGTTVSELVDADPWTVTLISYRTCMKLMDLLKSTKIIEYI